MIKANELRIGNYLQGDPLSIPRLQMYHNGITAITGFGISAIENGNITSLKPIPLTIEILKNCGFVNRFDIYYTINNIISFTSFEGSIAESFICGDAKIKCKIKYLHQLQNLFFALTNEELKIGL